MPQAPTDELFTRDEVLGGMPRRRARLVLFLIQCRAIQAMQQRQKEKRAGLLAGSAGIQATLTGSLDAATIAVLLDQLGPADQGELDETSFLKSMGLDPEVVRDCTFEILEKYAGDWEAVVPPDARLRAAVAHLLGQKYRFSRRSASRTRNALGLDSRPVAEAYQKLFGKPLDSVYLPDSGIFARLFGG